MSSRGFVYLGRSNVAFSDTSRAAYVETDVSNAQKVTVSRKSEAREPVEIQFKGRIFTGSYTVSSGMVHVISLYGRKSTRIGGMTPQLLARTLFKEIIQEADAVGTLD